MAIYNVGRDIDNRELGIGKWASGIGHRELEVETVREQGQASSDAQRTMTKLIAND